MGWCFSVFSGLISHGLPSHYQDQQPTHPRCGISFFFVYSTTAHGKFSEHPDAEFNNQQKLTGVH